MKKIYLLSVRFSGMDQEDSIYLTDAGQPSEIEEEHLAEYVRFLKQGEGFLGDLGEVYGDNWDVEQVFAHEILPRVEQK